MGRQYEFRDPIHGFILVNEWERAVIDHPAFQRLRRIRQLGWTDYVYPSATHSRFEHSLGVMHVAGRVFDALRDRAKRQLEDWLSYDEAGFLRDRQILRFAALLHDVGHPPFSHASDELFPSQYSHEDYSAEIIRRILKESIEGDPANRNYKIQAEDIADLLLGGIPKTTVMRLFWRSLVTGNLDADRADYLLRDSYFTGTAYGHYDLERLIPGWSLWREMEIFSEAGLPPMDVLKAATWNGAYAIGRTDQLGSVEPSKLADFVVLDANPLENISNVRQVHRVIKGGVIYDRKELLKPLVGKAD